MRNKTLLANLRTAPQIAASKIARPKKRTNKPANQPKKHRTKNTQRNRGTRLRTQKENA